MARVTVEDCVDKVDNRFKLVLIAAHRARMISNGDPLTIERDKDKNHVVALREIAEETVNPDDLEVLLVHSLQKEVEVDEPESDAVPTITVTELETDEKQEEEPKTKQLSEDDLREGMMDLVPPDITEEV